MRFWVLEFLKLGMFRDFECLKPLGLYMFLCFEGYNFNIFGTSVFESLNVF